MAQDVLVRPATLFESIGEDWHSVKRPFGIDGTRQRADRGRMPGRVQSRLHGGKRKDISEQTGLRGASLSLTVLDSIRGRISSMHTSPYS